MLYSMAQSPDYNKGTVINRASDRITDDFLYPTEVDDEEDEAAIANTPEDSSCDELEEAVYFGSTADNNEASYDDIEDDDEEDEAVFASSSEDILETATAFNNLESYDDSVDNIKNIFVSEQISRDMFGNSDDEPDEDFQISDSESFDFNELDQEVINASQDFINDFDLADRAAIGGGESAKKSEARTADHKELVENGVEPILLAERFLQVHHLCKFNGDLYLYGYNNFPIYSKIEMEELRDVIFDYFRDVCMEKGPELVVRICKSVQIQARRFSENEIEETERRYIATRNVILDLDEKGAVLEHTPEIFLRYLWDVFYDPDDNDHRCFMSFLNSVMQEHPERIKSILEMMAFLTFPTKFTKAVFTLIGKPNTGKSVLTSLVQSFFLADSVSNIALQELAGNFKSDNIARARINIDADLPNKIITEREISFIKKISGGDYITAEAKYKQPRRVKAVCKFLFASNFRLMLATPDEAFLQRLHIIPFDNPVDKEDQDLELLDKLLREKSAIFNLLYSMFFILKDNGFRFNDCVSPDDYCSVYEKPEKVSAPSVIEDFFEEYFEVTGDSTDFIPTADIERAFKDICREKHTEYLVPGFTQKFKLFITNNYSADEVRDARRGSNKQRSYCRIKFKNTEQSENCEL